MIPHFYCEIHLLIYFLYQLSSARQADPVLLEAKRSACVALLEMDLVVIDCQASRIVQVLPQICDTFIALSCFD